MKTYLGILSCAALFVACSSNSQEQTIIEPIDSISMLPYPETKKVEVTDNYFGTAVVDPYRWLEDDMADDTKAWVIEENKVTENYLSQIPFRDAIKDRLTELW